MPDTPIGSGDHRWFRARLDAHHLALLDEADDRRFLAHAESCADCGAALKAYSESAARLAREGHIPAGILARWDRARKKLRGLPRRMVREHLASCAECREDLEAVGFRPELEELAEEETEPEAALGESVASPARPTTVGRAAPPRWAPWILGGATGAALATAAAVLIVANAPEHAANVPAGPGPAATMIPTRPGPEPVVDVLPPSGTLRGNLRGPGDDVTTIRIGAETRFVHLALPDLFLSDTTTVSLKVVGPDGADRPEIRRRYDELFHRRTLLFGNTGAALEPGDYRLVVSAPFDGESAVAEFRFRLER